MLEVEIRLATEEDVPLILRFIKELAAYERLSHEVTATEEDLRGSLFGEFRVAETLLAYLGDEAGRFCAVLSTTSRPFWESPASTWKTST